jgi:AraC family transcriptional regulator
MNVKAPIQQEEALLPVTAQQAPQPGNDPLQRVLQAIERSDDAPLSVTQLAALAGLSPYHFSRLFTARIGESVMAYVRGRRLLRAAARLAENPGVAETPPAPTLIDLAFDCGFESQEAFTRAFKQMFGVTPGRFRREPARHQTPALERAMESSVATAKPNVVLLDGITRKPAFVVAGLSVRIGKTNVGEIPTVWPRLTQHLPFAGQRGDVGYGVCYGSDITEGSFNYMAAVEIDPAATPPAGLTLLQVPAQSYIVFRITLTAGEIHPQMQAAMRTVFADLLPASQMKPSGGIDLEVYGDRFKPGKAGSIIDFYMPVEG